MWVVMIIVFGGIIAAFLDGFENAGFDRGEFYGHTKSFIKNIIGYILLPIIIWFKK